MGEYKMRQKTVLEFLMASPGQKFTTKEVAAHFGASVVAATMMLKKVMASNPDTIRREGGPKPKPYVYWYEVKVPAYFRIE